MEVTITMLVAGLLIGITYSVYSIVIQSYRSFEDKNERMIVLVSLDRVIKRDFDRADSILRESDGVTLIDNGHIVEYAFYPDFILRKTGKIDTFKVKNQNWITSFENTPVNELQTTTEQNRVDQLDFTIIFENEKIPYHYHKLYSSENLIQRNPNALN